MALRHHCSGLVVVLTAFCCLTALVATGSNSAGASPASVQSPTRPRTVTTSSGRVPDLGPGASLHGKQLFPPDNPWNQDISNLPVDPNSANFIKGMGPNDVLHPDFGTTWQGRPNGIPYIVVVGTQPPVPISFRSYGGESDPGPYPVPRNAPIEGGPDSDSDRHVLVIDRDH